MEGTCTTSSDYRPRHPEDTTLYHVVLEHLETFLAETEARGQALPGFVVDELRGFLECGQRAYGFARVWCPTCHHEFAVPFSCGGRGFCPSCCGRFMAATAAHLIDHVLPDVPYRQWVLTLPYDLRYRAAYDPELMRMILRIFADEVGAWYANAATRPGGQWGATTVIQRFNSALRLSPHAHTLGFDGVFHIDAHGNAAFEYIPGPSDDDVASIVERVYTKVRAELVAQGVIDEDGALCSNEPDALATDEPSLAACYGGAVSGTAAFGQRRGQRAIHLGRIDDAPFVKRKSYLCADAHGFNLHAAVVIDEGDRRGLERLCRYLARPPLAHDRLTLVDDDHVSVRLKRRWSDGTTHVVLSFSELLQRLAALIPRPGSHRVRYHGILASRARHRRLVVPKPSGLAKEPTNEDGAGDNPSKDPSKATPTQRFRRLLWAELLVRVFGPDSDPLSCANCGGRMRVLSSIHQANVIEKILGCLGLPSVPPQVRPARGPPDTRLFEFTWGTADWGA